MHIHLLRPQGVPDAAQAAVREALLAEPWRRQACIFSLLPDREVNRQAGRRLQARLQTLGRSIVRQVGLLAGLGHHRPKADRPLPGSRAQHTFEWRCTL